MCFYTHVATSEGCVRLMMRDVFHCVPIYTPSPTKPFPFTTPSLFCPSLGRDRDRHKKDGPVSGVENGPYCFTRDSGGSGWKEEEEEKDGERERIVLTIDCNLLRYRVPSFLTLVAYPILQKTAQATCSGR